MTSVQDDKSALAEAFGVFIKSTQTLEEAYRRLEQRVVALDKELADKNRDLEVATDYLRSVLESISDGVIAVATNGVITMFNHAASNVLGFRSEEIEGKLFRETFGREFQVPRGRRAMELRARDGKPIPVTESDSPLCDRGGKLIGTVKVFQDMRELEALREQVRQKDRLAAIGEMAATVAHEIRNPLGGIRGFAALLAKDISIDDPRRRLVAKVLEGAKELDNVVSELLEYTRPIQVRLRATSCADVMDAALGYVDLNGRDISISKDIEPSLSLLADPDKMRQVMLNILLNAVQSIGDSGHIQISAKCEDDSIVMAVSDSGCGMAREHLDNVFSPFYTTKEKGTGLGLALAQKIVTAHGGTIDAMSTLGSGSTFFIRLPQAT